MPRTLVLGLAKRLDPTYRRAVQNKCEKMK